MQHPENKHAIIFAKNLLQAHLNEPEATRIKLKGDTAQCLEALFPGTQGGNFKFMMNLMGKAIEGNISARKNYFPSDPDYINEEIQNSSKFKATQKMMADEYDSLAS